MSQPGAAQRRTAVTPFLGEGDGGRARFLAVLWGLTFVALARADAPVPPPAPPFALPLLDGETRTHEPPQGRMERGALPDPRALFDLAMGCYPSRSLFRAEIALEGRAARRQAGADALNPAEAATGSGASYVGVVARIPLYSALEIDRERERELRRRKAAAEAVGALTQALAEWGVASRKLALFRALEKRAQERVAVGVAETGEQVQYLKEVADLEGRLNESRAKVVEARMTFIGLCAEGAPAERVDAYIRRFTRGVE
jgi:hypothetical protein